MPIPLSLDELHRVTGGGANDASCWNATKNAWDVAGLGSAAVTAASCSLGVQPPEARNTPEQTATQRARFESLVKAYESYSYRN